METRIAKLEEFAEDTKQRLARIETRLDQTITEMHKGFADMIKWIVGTAIVLGGTAITVITFVLNNAALRAPAAPPVVIYTLPLQAAPVAPPRM